MTAPSSNPRVHTFDNGVRLYEHHLIKPQIDRYSAGPNLHEPVEEEWIARTIAGLPGGTFVDIGAAVGYYCFFVRSLNPAMKLHAYEPDPDNRARLLENAALNQVTDIALHNEAIAPVAGGGVLVGSGYVGFVAPPTPEWTSRGRAVPTTTIDAIARVLGPIALLKMDIQGGEFDALAGADESLRAGRVANWIIGTHSAEIHRACLGVLGRNPVQIVFEAQRVDHQPDGIIVAKAVTPPIA
jgi:FkbM family methyltransferase